MEVDILLTMEVDCLLPRHGGASIQSRAYSNSSYEIGIRPDTPVQAVRCVACWPTRPARRLRASRKHLLFAQIPHNAPARGASARRSTVILPVARRPERLRIDPHKAT